jgi:hypothetical protein
VPDLDVNGDGDLADATDGLRPYLPGYEGATAKLHSGSDFAGTAWAGPQSMRLILPGVGSGSADEAWFTILNSSSWPGWCSNGFDPAEPLFIPWKDFSLAPAFDLGAGLSPGAHKRLGTARKEVLLQVHEMAEITDPSQNNANAAVQQFDLNARFQALTNFYADTIKGGALDLYGVKIPISDAGPAITCSHGKIRGTTAHPS